MARRRLVVAAVLSIVAAAAVVASKITAPDPFAAKVQAIVQTPQARDGEVIDNLVALGPDAVPAIGAALATPQPFPLVFVRALDRLGDPRGMEPILAFVATQSPYSDHELSSSTALSILALRGVGNPRACGPVMSILRDTAAHPRVRLAAASTSARLCSGSAQAEAQAFILDAYDRRGTYLADPRTGVSQQDLVLALIDADNERSLSILSAWARRGGASYEVTPIVEYLAGKHQDSVTDVLHAVLDDESREHEFPSRMAAARALLDRGRVSAALQMKLDELASEAEHYSPELAAETKALRARADPQ